MDRRGAAQVARLDPGPFHCLGCRTYVTGTPSGHCPNCGWVPPVAPQVPEEPARPPLLSGTVPPFIVVLTLVCMLAFVVIALLA